MKEEEQSKAMGREKENKFELENVNTFLSFRAQLNTIQSYPNFAAGSLDPPDAGNRI
jgi:hypothetical protein